MKKTLAILLLAVSCIAAGAAEQEHDTLVFNGKEYTFSMDWEWKTPLDIFYSVSGYDCPFRASPERNSRGFSAGWEIRDSLLFLTKISLTERIISETLVQDVPLGEVFFDHVKDKSIRAGWFSGIIRCSDKQETVYLIIKNGLLVRDVSARRGQQENSVIDDMYRTYLLNQQLEESAGFPVLSADQLEYTGLYIRSLYDTASRLREERKREEIINRNILAKALYSGLEGYDKALENYTILSCGREFSGTDTASVLVELCPRALPYIRFSWYIPERDPGCSWFDFIRAAGRITGLVNKQVWLTEWINEQPGRGLRIRLYGNESGKGLEGYTGSSTLGWTHAGLNGKPYCTVYIDGRNRRYRGKLLLGADDDHAFITLLYNNSLRGYRPDEFEQIISETGKHWFSVVSVDFQPAQEVPEYLIVDPAGNWILNRRRQ